MDRPIFKILYTIATALAATAMLGWFIVRTVRKAEEPARMVVKWIITLPIVAFGFLAVPWYGAMGPYVIVFCGVALSIIWTPHIGATFCKPLTSLFDGGDLPPEPRPLYSIAQAKQKRGEYLEAIAAIRRQLERFPTDFEGHMLLAQIQAEDLKDLSAAETTIQELCDQRGHAPKNLTFALFSMADWHLKVGEDRQAARRDLQKVIDLLPDTEFALTAAQRIAHLANPDMVLGSHSSRKFVVPESAHNLGLVQPSGQGLRAETDPGLLAAEYVRHLQQHPLDTEVREKLAVLYADHYGRLDLATDQLEQMIAEPHQPAKSVAHWLNVLADLQIHSGVDFDAVKETLQRIIDPAPHLAAAEIARKRIDLLKLELKASQQKQAVKLGTYEQNIGLRQKPPVR
jgi:tetratricopeptide (TPR) repeat protein